MQYTNNKFYINYNRRFNSFSSENCNTRCNAFSKVTLEVAKEVLSLKSKLNKIMPWESSKIITKREHLKETNIETSLVLENI